MVNPDGEVVNASKYTYAMTYAIYGLAEHYLATGNDESLKTAVSLYHVLEEKGRERCMTVMWNLLPKIGRSWTNMTIMLPRP